MQCEANITKSEKELLLEVKKSETESIGLIFEYDDFANNWKFIYCSHVKDGKVKYTKPFELGNELANLYFEGK